MFVLLFAMVGYTYFSGEYAPEGSAVLTEPRAHVQLITQNSNEHFWSTFKRGALDAGKRKTSMSNSLTFRQKTRN
ncbi:hypothetical protein [Anaeromassilibacillus sp. SJQ-1]|uniref:hypothetical protein n=1 Tax=Anaeromassilibacillus sp. SJQ-1 TaxID=3375419 RepID=UPI0039898D86